MSDVQEPDDWPAAEGDPRPPEQERRGQRGDRRQNPVGDRRREGGRRAVDVASASTPLETVWVVAWALIGAIVVMYLFFLAIGGVDPDDSPAVSIAVLVLAVLWFAHAWRRVTAGGASPVGDRERRGF